MQKLFVMGLVLTSSLWLTGCTWLENKQKAGLQVVTDAHTASLFLNAQYLDKTPYINKAIKPGTYSLKIEPEDKSLAPLETSIALNQGTLTVVTWNPGKTPETSGGVTYELVPHTDSKTAEIEFHTVPDSALVTFDNQEQTFSPLTLSAIEPGNHEFEVKLPSYQTQKHTMNAVAGKKLIITVKLAKELAPIDPSTSDQAQPNITPSAPTSSSGSLNLNTQGASLSAKLLSETITTNLNSPTASDSVTSGPRVKILPTNFFQNQQEVVRVRASADTTSTTIGYLQVGLAYPYLKNKSNGFYQVQFGNRQSGFVSETYAQLLE